MVVRMTYAADGQRRRGRPPRLSRDQIVDAACELGIENLTMAAVAERLGVTHQSLYGWVQDRDELIDLVSDRMLATVELPETGSGTGWRCVLRALASALRRIGRANPGYAGAALGRYRTGPGHLDLNRRVVASLSRTGFDIAMAQRSYETVVTVVLGWQAREDACAPLGEALGHIADDLERTAMELGGPYSIEAATAACAELRAAADERFEFLIQTVIAGLPDPAPRKSTELDESLLDIREPGVVIPSAGR